MKINISAIRVFALAAVGTVAAFGQSAPLQSCTASPNSVVVIPETGPVTWGLAVNPDPANVWVRISVTPAPAVPDSGYGSTDYSGFTQTIPAPFVRLLFGYLGITSYTGHFYSWDGISNGPTSAELCSLTLTLGGESVTGFFAPIYMGTVANLDIRHWPKKTPVGVNPAKSGSNVPLKWEIFNGAAPDTQRQGSLKLGPSYPAVTDNEVTDVAAVKSISYAYNVVSCEYSPEFTGAPTTVVESGWKYDVTAGQFGYNWKVPREAGCYQVTMTTVAGNSISAQFDVK